MFRAEPVEVPPLVSGGTLDATPEEIERLNRELRQTED